MTFVREDDNEYDVAYEDGTVFTIPSKDVKKRTTMASAAKEKKAATPSRSRSRGRSPGRKVNKYFTILRMNSMRFTMRTIL